MPKAGENQNKECQNSQRYSDNNDNNNIDLRSLVCPLSVGSYKTHALLDTGAEVSLISSAVFKKIAQNFIKMYTKSCEKLNSITGHNVKTKGKCCIQVQIGKENFEMSFVIVEKLPKPFVFGIDFFTNFQPRIDWRGKTLTLSSSTVLLHDRPSNNQQITMSLVRTFTKTIIPPRTSIALIARADKSIRGTSLITPIETVNFLHEQDGLTMPSILVHGRNKRIFPLQIVNNTTRNYVLKPNEIIAYVEKLLPEERKLINSVSKDKVRCLRAQKEDIEINNVQTVTEEGREVELLLNKYSNIFAQSDTDLGQTDLVEMVIDTGDHLPLKQRLYCTPFSQRQYIDSAVSDMLNAGIIRESNSPWSSPVVIVPKKDGTRRFCVDYRRLNSISKHNSFPLPNIDDMISSLNGAKWFTTLDLRSGYWQIKMADDSIPKTAFNTGKGLYEFNVLPFGLTSAPPCFQELMQKVLIGYLDRFVMAYLDDIIIYTDGTLKDHINHIEMVFLRLKQANLKLKLKKCTFAQNKVPFLGHIVSARGISPDPEKVAAIKNMPRPITVRGVRRFIGVTSYYRRYIPGYADLARPLTMLTRKNAHFNWGPEQESSYNALKNYLINIPVMAYPDLQKPYTLYTDASDYCIGGVLTQQHEDGEHVIQYLSHQLTKGQQKWPTIEKEGYAIVYAVNKLRHYLLGSKFTIYTDHKPLRSLFTSEMRNPRIQRWAIMLDEYGCDIEYRSGKTHVQADMMSRLTSDPTLKPQHEFYDDSDEHLVDNSWAILSCDKNSCDMDMSILASMSPNDLSKLQHEDEALSDIIRMLKLDNKCKQNKDFVLLDDILYHVSDPVKRDQTARLQLVIPASLQGATLIHVHDKDGHLGVDKTYDKLRTRYFWYNMYKDVVLHVSSCDLCKMNNLRAHRAPMQLSRAAVYPFEIVGIDIVGPFVESHSGNKYILTVVDHFSSYPEAFPIPNKNADTITDLLLTQILPRHSCMSQVTSDNGLEFVNHIVDDLLRKMGIGHVRTSPYHPEGNAKVERFHRFLNSTLRKYTIRDQRSWDTLIPGILWSYRTSVHEGTLYTPFFLVHGRDPVLPLDTLLRPRPKYVGEEYLPCMLERIHQAFTEAQQNSAEARLQNKNTYNKRAKDLQFKIGDAVYYRLPPNNKLDTKWQAHARIIQQTSPVSFIIKELLTGKTRRVHASDLAPAYPDSDWDTPRTYQSHLLAPEYANRVQPLRSCRLAAEPSLARQIVEPTAIGRKPVINANIDPQPTASSDGDGGINPDRDTSQVDTPSDGRPGRRMSTDKRHRSSSGSPYRKKLRSYKREATKNDDTARNVEMEEETASQKRQYSTSPPAVRKRAKVDDTAPVTGSDNEPDELT